ncbi:YebC/PmpR family DNA-binding transcriptional regulator [candidate division KSB1 bacterium]|nr:YebC/PmpR family DNA-binding transcriptional regulator [candidate division KSB1 bacterium]
MSGHSKWATIKRKKAKIDAARGKVFTKLIKDLMVAAREGGGDESSNASLRTAIAAAKAANMPVANIDRAIKRGTGELDGVNYEEITYEGYGPGGAAILIEVVTDNKNRTVADMRHFLSKHGGNLGENGCVAWMFEKKGVIVINNQGINEDELMMLVLDAGAEDLRAEDNTFEVITAPENFEAVKDVLVEKKIPFESAEVSMIPKTTVKVEGALAERLLKLVEVLEEHDDVQNVYSNFDIDFSKLDQSAA